MQLEIISPEKVLYSGDIRQVRVPGSKGSFAVLHNHAPITSTLDKGIVKVTEHTGQELLFKILKGVIQVKNNTITVLVFKEEE